MEAYDLLGRAAGANGDGEALGTSASVAVRLGPAPTGVAFAGLTPGSLDMQDHPASDSPLALLEGRDIRKRQREGTVTPG